jgi:hypothetical protein
LLFVSESRWLRPTPPFGSVVKRRLAIAIRVRNPGLLALFNQCGLNGVCNSGTSAGAGHSKRIAAPGDA